LAPIAALNDSAHRPWVTVIIPCRDKPDLLEACVTSLARTKPTNFDIIIVENDSEQEETFSLYDRLKSDSRVRILFRPGPFNFSALCNSAAAEVTTPVMVFLNNDTIIETPDWLETLAAWALRPNVGAVGTKLIYPSRVLQHAGAVVGLGGYAAHSDQKVKADSRGYMGKLAAIREVSAVTGACMAVEKAKFDKVGGFDAETFPNEFSDMDFCLRLREAGWTTICLSEPILIHHESATRGTPQDLDTAYGAERRAFKERWSSVICDDPYYHPALSLHSSATALDR
jgi:GT2 family glycosyltransferase